MKYINAIRAAIGKERFIRKAQKTARNIPVEKMEAPIDFVVTWVDGSDPDWIKEKSKYEEIYLSKSERSANGEERFRNWDTLKYWFRAIEQYAPWVNNVYFITCGHTPDWLNLDAPKLKHIKHTDYIPEKYLPTFNSIPIELNMFRIDNLAEHFVYFNDDVFLAKPVTPEDFFCGGLPVFSAVVEPCAINTNSVYDHMRYAIVSTVNKHFKGRLTESIQAHPEKWFYNLDPHQLEFNWQAYNNGNLQGIHIHHFAKSYQKSYFKKVWDDIPETMDSTSSHRFRTGYDVLDGIISIWNLMDGSFFPVRTDYYGKYFSDFEHNHEEISESFKQQKYRMICLNDTEVTTPEKFESSKKSLLQILQHTFPNKSSFEK